MSEADTALAPGPKHQESRVTIVVRRSVLLLVATLLAFTAIALLIVRAISDDTEVAMIDPLTLLSVALLVAGYCANWMKQRERVFVAASLCLLVSLISAFILLSHVHASSSVSMVFWLLVVAAWFMAWACVELLSSMKPLSMVLATTLNITIPIVFGAWLLILWEILTVGFDVPQVLLPSPGIIGQRFITSSSILWADFQQTFLKAVLIGYFIGCSAGFIVAILIDRSPFLQRGLLPVGNLVSALPIVGVAPIMVMWFGFDWHSKAAVVVIMTFFPMLVNTIAGLSAAHAMQQDLMKTYAASYWQSLFKLRVPEALPFIFNALKINSTLAMIGAIVAEFFGTPTVGMGFRISTEVGRMNVDMVWAEIAVAALAGSLFYGAVALLERVFTFWHPSMRS